MSDFGSAFGPIRPPEPTHDERQHNEIVDALIGIQVAQDQMVQVLVAMAEQEKAVQVIESTGDLSPLLEALNRPHPIPPSPEAMAEALARRLPDHSGEMAVLRDSLAAVAKNLERLNKKVTAMSVMPSGGASGHVIVDSGQVTLTGSEFPWSSVDRVRVDALGKESTLELVRAQAAAINADLDVALSTRATEATLAAVLAAVDTLEALTTDLRTELRRRPVHRLDSSAASIVSGVFATVHTVTPTVAVVVTGYNSDLNATGTFNYRQRLITGTDAAPVVATQEQLSTAQNSWTRAPLSVPAGTRIAVQVLHGEVTAQEFRASLAYYEEP